MADMLVKLYALPNLEDAVSVASATGVTIRRTLAPEKPVVLEWVAARFPAWTAEVEAAMSRLPITCFVAHRGPDLLGFACYDAIAPNFFGPAAVAEPERGKGLGRALLLAALHAQRAQGYAYAIIGGVGPAAFYEKAVGAVPIEDSTPGLYAGLIRPRR